MPVTCLTNAEKLVIKSLYLHTANTQAEIAEMYGVVPSTIHKVLKEFGMATTYKKQKQQNEDSQILALLKAEGIDLNTLIDILSLWNPRMFEAVVMHTAKNKEPA